MKTRLFMIVLASVLCLLAFTGCNKGNDAAKADDAKVEAKADDNKADAKADEAKADAKADEAKADAKADDPSIEDVCKHTASCFENSSIERCVAMTKDDPAVTKCPAEFKAMQKCMIAASCDDIKADKACKAENDALLACKGNSAKE